MKTLSAVAALIAASATHGVNVLRLASAGQDGETVTIDGVVFELDTHTTPNVTNGRVRVDVSGGTTVKASRVLTLSGNAVADETVTIGTTVYTWKATPVAAFQVQVGVDAATSIQNLLAAIAAGAGAGTTYGTGTTAHPLVTATGNATTVTATAKAGGTAGNAIASTETMTNGAWAGTTLTGGVDPTAANVRDALVTAINGANVKVEAFALGAQVVIRHEIAGKVAATTETLAGANNAWAAATTYGEAAPSEIPAIPVQQSRVVSAAEATAEAFALAFNAPVLSAEVSIRTAAGAFKAFDGKVTISGRTVLLASDGSTDLASTDVVTVTARVAVQV